MEKILKQRELQVQLAEAKIAKMQMDHTEEKEKLLIEKKGHLEVSILSYSYNILFLKVIYMLMSLQILFINLFLLNFSGNIRLSTEGHKNVNV